MSQEIEICPECNGDTVMFKGRGLYLEYKICSRWKGDADPLHWCRDDIVAEIYKRRQQEAPKSGRQA